jgi:hypothetical protein
MVQAIFGVIADWQIAVDDRRYALRRANAQGAPLPTLLGLRGRVAPNARSAAP